jgi:23S rRNA (guanine745-N1)-methyltransferase
MLRDVIDRLICPLCARDLFLGDGAVRCARGHAFDVAREGYVNLLPGSGSIPGDSRAMIEARESFLEAGHYRRLADCVAGIAAGLLQDGPPAVVVDAGAGTGYYRAHLLEREPRAAGPPLDVSKFAIRRASRAHPRIGAAVCDIWKALPVKTGAAQVILDVFAPRNAAEFKRVLHPDGALLVVTPTARHLRELVEALDLLSVDRHKDERLQASLGRCFEPQSTTEHEETRELSRDDACMAAAMGPSAFHAAPEVLRARAATLPNPLPVTISATISVYRPKRDA